MSIKFKGSKAQPLTSPSPSGQRPSKAKSRPAKGKAVKSYEVPIGSLQPGTKILVYSRKELTLAVLTERDDFRVSYAKIIYGSKDMLNKYFIYFSDDDLVYLSPKLFEILYA